MSGRKEHHSKVALKRKGKSWVYYKAGVPTYIVHSEWEGDPIHPECTWLLNTIDVVWDEWNEEWVWDEDSIDYYRTLREAKAEIARRESLA